ncbi:hypothetical protein DEU52_1439 [Ensifer adhaerens]|nr:hypothetical protein DEU52_1439 [Ensifer adhaerens]
MPKLRERLSSDGLLLGAGFIMHRVKLPAGDADMVPSNH